MATTVAILATTVATTVVIDSLCEVTKAGLHERPWLLDIDAARCPLLAHSGHPDALNQCPLLGVKRTSLGHASMSAFDPKRTFGREDCCHAK